MQTKSKLLAILTIFAALPIMAQQAKTSRMSHSNTALRPPTSSLRQAPAQKAQHAATPYIYNVEDGEADFSAYLRYDTRCRTYGWAVFSSAAPSGYELVADYGMVAGTTPVITAATYVGDEIYAYETTYYTNTIMPTAFSVIDAKTGNIVRKATIDSDADYLILDEMTYDPKTQTLFGMHYDTDAYSTDLYTIDTTTFLLTKVATMDQPLYTLAADNGWLYGVTVAKGGTLSSLVKIDQASIDADKQSCTVQRVSPATGTGLHIGNYSQSMEFDKTTHRLWWMAQGSDDKAYWVELDANSGVALSKAEVAGAPQMLAMSAPYQYVADAAPSYVRSLSATAGANGELTAKLSWVNPTTDYRNNALTSLTAISISRNGQPVATLGNAAMGEAMEWTDQGMADGLYTYRVTTRNDQGDGVYKEAQLYIGEDVPGAPANVTLTVDGNKGTLTWQAPTTGAHGGYFDASTLRYDVVRLPDSVAVAQASEQCTIDDEVTAYAGYSYVVTAINDKGRGASATSNTVAYGQGRSIPYISPLNTQEDFNQWTAIDANADGNTWAYNAYNTAAIYDRNENMANDWLVSPPLMLDASKQYQARYTYYTANWVDPSTYEPVTESMTLYYGQQPTVDALQTVVSDMADFHTASGEYLHGKVTFSPAASGAGYLAFKARSDADQGQIYLKDVSVREYSANDLSANGLTGSTTANCNVSQTMTVAVTNEGSATVSDYTVALIDADTGETLAQTAGTEVKPEATVEVPVEWTPAAEGTVRVQARVLLDTDTYPADNLSATVLSVSVEAEAADKWITLGSDDSSGYNAPFYLSTKYSQVQCLYLDKEMQKKNIDITAMQFIYNGYFDTAYTFPARISMKTTERTHLLASEDDPYTGTFEEDGWATVFEGDITLDSNSANTELNVTLDNSFHYDGGNVNVKFESLLRDDRLTTTHPEWHLCDVTGNSRMTMFRGSTDVVSADYIFAYDYMPFMRMAYNEGGSSGITAPAADTMGAWQVGGTLYLAQTCDAASLYTLSGAKVCTAGKTSKMDVSGLKPGIYLLSLTANGLHTTTKVAITRR